MRVSGRGDGGMVDNGGCWSVMEGDGPEKEDWRRSRAYYLARGSPWAMDMGASKRRVV